MGTMRLPSKCVLVAFLSMPLQVLALIQAPSIVGRVELTRLLFENLKSEMFHIPYQHDGAQLRVLLRGFFNTGIPNLQDLPTSVLNVRQWVLVSERKDRGGTSRYEANTFGSDWITCLYGLGRPSRIAQSDIDYAERAF